MTKEQEYRMLAHAMQAGVATIMNIDPKETEPKHLRVGVNVALSDACGLAKLLMAKGIFTEEELFDSTIEAMKEEVKRYEETLSKHYGRPIKLGGLP